jgi:hypothetical protein
MALMVGTLQAVITADRSQHTRELRAAEADDKQFKSRTSKDKAKIDGDAKPFERESQRAIRSAGIMRTKIGGFVGELRGELLAVGAVAGIVGGFRAVVMAASDLSESANAINVTFGQAASKVFAFTSTASKSIGQSDAEARGAAATFGVYGKQAGLAADQNAAFSISLVKLASDMASFRNTSPQEAIEALGAALRGESDPIEAYGVLLTESVIQQRALKMGVIETTAQALTPQQRVMVAYQEILEQTKDSQGDFGRTSGEFANQLRTLRARVIDQAAALGQDLLPAAKSLVGFLTSSVGPAFDILGGILKIVLGVVGDVATAWNSLPGPIQAALVALIAWNLVQDRVTGGFDKMSSPLKSFADDVRDVATASDGAVTKFGASMQVLQERSATLGAMGSAFRTTKGDADGFTSSIRGVASAAAAGLKTGLSSLVGFLGGPWGVAIAIGTAVLGTWVAANERAKAEQAKLASAAKTVADAIAEQNGEINKNVRQKAALAAEDSGLLALAGRAKVSGKQVTEMVIDQGNAYERNYQQLYDLYFAKAEKLGADNDEVRGLKSLLDAMDAYHNEQGKGIEGEKRVAEATGLTTEQVTALAGAAGVAEEKLTPVATAMKVMADESATAEDKISALQQALDEMTQENLTVEEATQAINDVLREMGVAFGDAEKAARKAGVELIDSAGAIDTTTEAGSNLQDKLVQLSSDYNGLFSATVAAAQAQGKSLPEALVAAANATTPMRQKFLDIAEAAGLNKDEVALLTQHYGMLPKQVSTSITQPGMMEGIMNALGLKGNIESIPNGWQTILSSTAPEQIALMESLGFKVTHLPNGRVLVTADTAQAWAEVNKILTPKTLIVNLQAQGFHGASLGSAMKQLRQANGGIVEYYAEGGLRPMSAATAGIVGSYRRTGVERVIGDNPVVDEAFIPLDRRSSRSQAILDAALQRMRPEWFTNGGAATPMGGGGYSGGSTSSPTATGSSYVDRSITMHAVPSVPTLQQLQDLQHEQDVLYG